MARKKFREVYEISEKEAEKIINNALNNGCLFWIESKAWGNRKQLASEISEEIAENLGVEKEMLNHTQRLLDSEEITEIRYWISKAFEFARKNSMPWITKGVYFIDKEKKEDVKEHIEYCIEAVKESVEKFKKAYPSLKKKAKEKSGKLYREEYYPHVDYFEDRFRLRYGLLPIVLPDASSNDKLSVLTKAELKEATQQQKELIKETIEQYIKTVRAGLLESLEHIKDMLKEDKKILDSTINKPLAMIEKFREQNIWGDKPFAELAEDIEYCLSGVDAKDLRDDKVFRNEMKDIINEVVKEVKELPVVEMKKSRALDF